MDEITEQEGRSQSAEKGQATERISPMPHATLLPPISPRPAGRMLPEVEQLHAKHSTLTLRIEELFRSVTTRFDPPPRYFCESIATLVMQQRHLWEVYNLVPNLLRYAALREAERMAISFLAALQPLRAGLPEASGDRLRDALNERRWIIERYQLDKAAQVVEAVLPTLTRIPAKNFYPIRALARGARVGWSLANGGKAPRGKNPDDPLVKFLVGLLPSLIGQGLSGWEVSDILRGRRRIRKPKGRAET